MLRFYYGFSFCLDDDDGVATRHLHWWRKKKKHGGCLHSFKYDTSRLELMLRGKLQIESELLFSASG